MKKTKEIIKKVFDKYEPAIAYSGGGDSTVLLDIVVNMGYKPLLIWTDTQQEYPEIKKFVKQVTQFYNLELKIAKSVLTPLEVWGKYGYSFLGKMPGRDWTRNHKGKNFGFKCDASTCCRKLKIAPGRKLLKELGLNCFITGQKGSSDDFIRKMRAEKDNIIQFVKSDKIYVANPLTGWTDLMIKRYIKNHNLPVADIKKEMGMSTGCMYCGGGMKFYDSPFRALRMHRFKEWHKVVIEWELGYIVLSIKYDKPLSLIKKVVTNLGGLESLAKRKPYIFDFLLEKPLVNYSKVL